MADNVLNNAISITPGQIETALAACVQADMVPYFQGQPGIGKTDAVRNFVESLGGETRIFLAAGSDPTDVVGIPDLSEHRTDYATPRWWPTQEDIETGAAPEYGCVFLDELPQGLPSTINALSAVILEGRAGNVPKPKTWFVAAAGNLVTHRAHANQLPTHILDRMVVYNVSLSADDWLAHAARTQHHDLVRAYIRHMPDHLSTFEDMVSKDPGKVFSTPRSWSRWDRHVKNGILSTSIALQTGAGLLGEGVTHGFMAFVNDVVDMPDPAKCLANPKKEAVPDEPSTRYALTAALSSRIRDSKTFAAAITYTGRMSGEFTAYLAQDAVRRDKSLEETDAFIDWAAANHELFT